MSRIIDEILAAQKPALRKYEPVRKIDYFGVERAHEKYKKLWRMFVTLTTQMANDGMEYESAEVRHWMRGYTGFTRAHTPYWVSMTKTEWDRTIRYIRKYQPDWYNHIRHYSSWVA